VLKLLIASCSHSPSFGYDQGVVSGLLTGHAWKSTFPDIDTTSGGHGSASLQGTVVAIYEIGCFFGAILCFLFGEKLGRRKSIMIGCVILTIGAVLQTAASSIAQLIVGRIVAGLGNGMNTGTIPVWHSELLAPAKRGEGLSIELAITIVGVMLSYWIDYGFSYINSEAQFRFPIAFQIFFAVLTFVGVWLLPESPRWVCSSIISPLLKDLILTSPADRPRPPPRSPHRPLVHPAQRTTDHRRPRRR
jgi:MFS family permease